MIWTFWAAVVAMLLLALAFVLPPLLRAGSVAGTAEAQSNLAVLRRRFQELRAEHDRGELTAKDYAEARVELERQVVEQTVQAGPLAGRGRRWSAWLVALLIPAVALPVYLQLGSQQVMEVQEQVARIQDDRQSQVAFIRENIGRLEQRVQASPEDGEGWLMLGRSYMVLERYQEAAEAYAQARERLGAQPDLLLAEAEARAYAGPGGIAAAVPLTRQALEQDPNNARALWFAGMLAAERGQPDEAARYWQRLYAVLPADSQGRAEVRRLLDELGEQPPPAAEAGAQLTVQVQLEPGLAAELAPETPVFVFAKAVDGPAAPLAVARRQLRELPLTVTLSDADAMVAGMTLSRFEQVRVEARVSLSGEPTAQPGDLQGRSAGVNPRQRQQPVTVTIDQRVE